LLNSSPPSAIILLRCVEFGVYAGCVQIM